MSLPVKKLIAVLLAIWLPLFSGNALAISVFMQAMDSNCPMAAQQGDHPALHVSVAHQHSTNQDQAAGNCDQQNSSCDGCDVCHLACSGYLAAMSVEMARLQLSDRLFAIFSAQFQSITTAPLDPPPLTRA